MEKRSLDNQQRNRDLEFMNFIKQKLKEFESDDEAIKFFEEQETELKRSIRELEWKGILNLNENEKDNYSELTRRLRIIQTKKKNFIKEKELYHLLEE